MWVRTEVAVGYVGSRQTQETGKNRSCSFQSQSSVQASNDLIERVYLPHRRNGSEYHKYNRSSVQDGEKRGSDEDNSGQVQEFVPTYLGTRNGVVRFSANSRN